MTPTAFPRPRLGSHLLFQLALAALLVAQGWAQTAGGTLTLSTGGTTLSTGTTNAISGGTLTLNGGTLNVIDPATSNGGILSLNGSNTTVLTGGVITTGVGGINFPPYVVFNPGLYLSYGATNYPAPTDGQKVQLGAALDFEKFRTRLILQNGTTNTTPRLPAHPPELALEFLEPTAGPRALVTTPDGTIYGVTPGGGSAHEGSIVSVTYHEQGGGQVTVLKTEASFTAATTGVEPGAVLIDDGAGHFLGVTRRGGAHGKGTIFRFDPADASLVTVFDFPADLVGVANGLVLGPNGWIYGISSALAEAETVSVPNAQGFTPTTLAEVGATLGAHGSIWRLTSEGEFWVLKTFDTTEASASGSLPPPPFVYYQQAPQPIYSAHVFYPCSLAFGDGGLYAWVSGGIFWFHPLYGTEQWLKPTAEVEVPGANAQTSGTGALLTARNRFFGRQLTPSDGPSSVVFTDEAPNFVPRAGVLYTARDTEELTTLTTNYTTSIRPSLGTVTAPAGGPFFSLGSRTRGVAFTGVGDDKYRVDTYPAGGAAIVHTSGTTVNNTKVRVLADFDRIFAVLPKPGPAPVPLLVVALARGGTIPHLYTITPEDNTPPFVPDIDVRGLLPYSGDSGYPIPIPTTAVDPNGDPLEVTFTTAGQFGFGSIYRGPSGYDTPQLSYYRDYETISGQQVTYPAVIQHDTITYTMNDGHGGTATGRVLVGNDFPVAAPDHAERIGDDADGKELYRAELLANDTDANGDPLSALIVLPAGDTVKITKSDDGAAVLFHVPPGSISDSRTVQYVVTDGFAMRVGQVLIGNRPPATNAVAVQTDATGFVSIPFDSIASDPDGDALTFTVVEGPSHGTISIVAGAITYTAEAGFWGTDTFKVRVLDGSTSMDQPVQVTVPFDGFRGTLTGLVTDGTKAIGIVRATSARHGKATVQLLLHGLSYRAVVTLTASGTGTIAFTGPHGRVITLALTVDGGGLGATVTIDGATSLADLAPPSAPTPGAAGRYNVVLERQSEAPMHYGFAILKINGRGEARLAGRTPDNQPWAASAMLNSAQDLAVFAQVGARSRSVAGTWHLDDSDDLYAISGDLRWKRGSSEEALSLGGSRYRVPRAGANVFGAQQSPVTLDFSAPGLSPQKARLTINRTNAGAQLSTRPLVRLAVNPATGVFSGSVMLQSKPLATSFVGVLRGTEGFGVLASSPGTGSVVLRSRTPTGLNLQTGGSVITGGLIITNGGVFPHPPFGSSFPSQP